MEQLIIAEAVHHVRRNSHRVKNAGNVRLFQKGIKIANKIKRSKNASSARQLESEYLELIKKEYASLGAVAAMRPISSANHGY